MSGRTVRGADWANQRAFLMFSARWDVASLTKWLPAPAHQHTQVLGARPHIGGAQFSSEPARNVLCIGCLATAGLATNRRRGNMSQTRTEAVHELLDSFNDVDLKYYFADPEPQGQWDSHLNGQIKALCGYCRTFGLTELVSAMDEFLPLQGNAMEALNLVRGFIIPEVRHHLATVDVEPMAGSTSWFWELMHPRIRAVAAGRFEAGFFADAVEASFKEINCVVKALVRDLNGSELDGAGLMTTAFSLQKPLIRLTRLETDSERNVQQGFMQILAGSMTGIRNPNAHGNLDASRTECMHLISLASLLMNKLDQRL